MKFGTTDPRERTRVDGTERAVSPVIGVILMVAITVILAAVIGVFVLGLGDELGDTAPSATVSFELSDAGDDLIITHDGGDSLELDEMSLLVNGTNVEIDWDGTLSAGESVEVLDEFNAENWEGVPEDAEDVQLRHDPSGTIIGSEDDL